ncbi:MAG: thymidine kinase [Hyphomonadaceae bacterium]
MAKLYFSYAAMNAGKSTILLQASYNYQERGMRTLAYTSMHHAKHDDGEIVSRLGVRTRARTFAPGDKLYAGIARAHRRLPVHCVFVDEAQFLTRDQVWELARVADELNIPVLCYGLRTDFRGELFEGSAALLAIADSLREIRTICHCGSKATMVVRTDSTGKAERNGEQVGVERGQYVSLCRKHWLEAMGRTRKTRPPAGSALHRIPAKRSTKTGSNGEGKRRRKNGGNGSARRQGA